jgi:hypothetical protein
MFNYEKLDKIRDLEMFLESRDEIIQEKKQSNLLDNIKNYFTGNSNILYTYKYNEKINEIDYNIPRTLSGDFKSIKNYFLKLINKN